MSTPATHIPSLRRQWFGALGAMLAWGMDFLLRYAISWSACVTLWQNFVLFEPHTVRLLLMVLTLVTGAVAASAGITAWRIGQALNEACGRSLPDQRSTPDPFARTRFMAVLGQFMAALFMFGILLQAVPGLLLPVCE